MIGQLYLVGVPIGNDEDITLRALRILKSVDIIAAEDTRKARRLLQAHSINTPRLLAHHSFNEQAGAEGLIKLLKDGQNIALISDAGMPTVSDPGYVLAQTALAAGFAVEVIPGVSAVTTALAGSGLPATPFTFVGFLPKKAGDVRKKLRELSTRVETLVFFESPRRLLETLTLLEEGLGNRNAVVARELTKTHQEWLRGTFTDIAARFANRDAVLGEITLVVEGAGEGAAVETNQQPLDDAIKQGLKNGLNPRELRDHLMAQYPLPKRDIYQRILELQK